VVCNHNFYVRNRVKFGAINLILSLDALTDALRTSTAGCVIGTLFFGSLTSVDDVVLINPHMRVSGDTMLSISES
jgi:hypothetical protein